ncbi:MAG: hypothetical protein D6701_08480 [Gemmatimonadetes bacterium]|nr:MAG: hypothetical protein D6701_08480 [Gemmatimonadota bacterium]
MATATALCLIPAPVTGQGQGDTIWIEGLRGLPAHVPAAVATAAGPPLVVRTMATPPQAMIRREGSMRVLVLLGLFADSGEPRFSPRDIETALFDPFAASVRTFYEEASLGTFSVQGFVAPWVRTSVTLLEAAGSQDGHGFVGERIRDFVEEVVRLSDASIDYRQFDNDGPDGIPNSGDDDGWLDALEVEFLEPAGSCPGGPGIWPHFAGLDVETDDIGVDGPIRIGAYFTESVTGCDGVSIQTPGTVAHEFGHRIGLPDYYRIVDGILPSQRHWNIGCFGVMGAGVWGCGSGPTGTDFGPTQVSALARLTLGWANEIRVGAVRNETFRLRPALTTGDVLRIDLDPSGTEYLLLEYRVLAGFDRVLPAPGVLVYHRDELWQTRTSEPGQPPPYPYYVVEADGDFNLRRVEAEGGNRGEASDVFGLPGAAASLGQFGFPSTASHSGAVTPVIIHEISFAAGEARVRVTTDPVPGVAAPPVAFEVVAGSTLARTFPVVGGVGPYRISVRNEGALPPGTTVTVDGQSVTVEMTGARVGSNPIEVEVEDARGQVGISTLVVNVVDADLPIAALLRATSGGAVPEGAAYLDESGNRNGRLDVGDVRAYMARTARWHQR